MDKTSNRDACKNQAFGLGVSNSPGLLESRLDEILSEQAESGHKPGVIVMKRGTIIKADHIRTSRSYKKSPAGGQVPSGMKMYVVGIGPSDSEVIRQSPSRYLKSKGLGANVMPRWCTNYGSIRRLPDIAKVWWIPLYGDPPEIPPDIDELAAEMNQDPNDQDLIDYHGMLMDKYQREGFRATTPRQVCSIQYKFKHILTMNPANVQEVFYLEEGDDLDELYARVSKRWLEEYKGLT